MDLMAFEIVASRVILRCPGVSRPLTLSSPGIAMSPTPVLLCPHLEPGVHGWASLSHLCVSLPLERHEHDARDQHPILTDEGEPALLDSEGLPVQRYVLG